MKCTTVRTKLAGYMDDAVSGSARVRERAMIREHLEVCNHCRAELQQYRRLSVLLSQTAKATPPADLAVRIKVAAAQSLPQRDLASRWHAFHDRVEILFDNVFRPLTVPATGGFFSAILVFAIVLQMIGPSTSVQAVQNDVPTNLLRPAEVISLSEYPNTWANGQHDVELSLPEGLLVDVTVDAQGTMLDYEIVSGPSSADLRHELDQLLFFSRFRPMMSFGRPTTGGHVILSFSAVHVRG